jgi:hypothetical protein
MMVLSAERVRDGLEELPGLVCQTTADHGEAHGS